MNRLYLLTASFNSASALPLSSSADKVEAEQKIAADKYHYCNKLLWVSFFASNSNVHADVNNNNNKCIYSFDMYISRYFF